jgi:Mechanosensitive ion channel/Conserved TM helix
MKQRLIEAFAGLGNSVAAAAPKVAMGILLIIFGLVIAKLVQVALRTILVRIHFDGAIARVGIDKALHRIGIRQKLSVVLPKIVYFLIILLLAQTGSDALGLMAISAAIGAFFSYLPNIIAALLLVILGSTVGQFAGQMVTQAAEDAGIDFAPSLGKLVSGLVIFIVAMMAIGQLKIDTQMVRIVTCFVLGAGALAFGLSFGLGTRDIVRNLVIGFYTRKFLVVGKRVDIGGQSGELTAITATHTILSNDDQELMVANSTFLEQTSRQ